MKLPKAVLTLTGVFAASLLFIGVFIYTAVQRRSLFSAAAAALAAAASVGIASVIEDYCRAASFCHREYFDVNRMINDFFSPLEAEIRETPHD